MVTVKDTKDWNNNLFYKWGQTMGQIHNLSKKYKPNKCVRKQWNQDIYFSLEYKPFLEDKVIYDKWSKIISILNLFPKDKYSYGLIHNDFHQYNFFVHKDNITVFDFDDCLYHWYIYDIVIALYHALACIPTKKIQKRSDFAWNYLKYFFGGYLKENKLEYVHFNSFQSCYMKINLMMNKKNILTT